MVPHNPALEVVVVALEAPAQPVVIRCREVREVCAEVGAAVVDCIVGITLLVFVIPMLVMVAQEELAAFA